MMVGVTPLWLGLRTALLASAHALSLLSSLSLFPCRGRRETGCSWKPGDRVFGVVCSSPAPSFTGEHSLCCSAPQLEPPCAGNIFGNHFQNLLSITINARQLLLSRLTHDPLWMKVAIPQPGGEWEPQTYWEAHAHLLNFPKDIFHICIQLSWIFQSWIKCN